MGRNRAPIAMVALVATIMSAQSAAAAIEPGPVTEHRIVDSTTAAGDLNGDGWADLAIGSAVGGVPRIDVIFGRPGLVGLDAPDQPGSAGLRLAPEANGETSAVPLAPAGDVDGDRYDDLSLAVRQWGGSPGSGVGARKILHGSRLSGVPAWSALGGLLSTPTANGSGASLAERAGDLDGDGRDDLLTQYSYNGPFVGLELSGGLSAPLALDGTWVASAAGAGDIDGDGRAELLGRTVDGGYGAAAILWSRTPRGGPVAFARTRVRAPAALSGWAELVPVGDVDGDSHVDVAVVEPGLPARVAFDLAAARAGDAATVPGRTRALPAGITPVGPAGDVNGDGIDDVLARAGDDARGDLVYPGSRDATSWSPAEAIAVAHPRGTPWSTVPAGDVDADGRDELIVRSTSCPADGTCTSSEALAGLDGDLPAVVRTARFAPSTFVTGAGRGTRILTELSAPSTVRLTFVPAWGGARRILETTRPAGAAALRWDGAAGGRHLPFGPYRVRIEPVGGVGSVTTSVFVLG